MIPEDFLAAVADLELSADAPRDKPFLAPGIARALLALSAAAPNHELDETRIQGLLRERQAAASEAEADYGVGVLLAACILQREATPGRMSVMIPGSGPFQRQARPILSMASIAHAAVG